MPKPLPNDLTSYDFLKTVAVILMIIDHIGCFFFPDELWFRAIGRLCVPLWFFLIGYARSRDLRSGLWIGGGILILASMVVGQAVLPLNILFSMLIARVLLEPVLKFALKNVNSLFAATVILTLLIIPTSSLWEYGTQGVLLAMIGYMVRHQAEVKKLHKDTIEFFMMGNAGLFLLMQFLAFGFAQTHVIFIAVGLCPVLGVLWYFKPMTYPGFTQKTPGVIKNTIRFTGRNTLEIYVIHLAMFKVAALLSGQDGFTFLDLKILNLPG